jgi:methylenetetrahydrofolate reductase (NADPH)
MTVEAGPKSASERLTSFVANAGLEIYPDSKILQKVDVLSRSTKISVTSSPTKGIEETLNFTKFLKEKGFEVVPHIAARSIKDIKQLEVISIFLNHYGIEEIFAIAGDNERPAGNYDSSVTMLDRLLGMTRTVTRVGVAGYPEGHPFVFDAQLTESLKAKADIAKKYGVGIHVDTQMCFDANAITDWIKYLHSNDVNIPIILGVPVTNSFAKLLQFSIRCGVGDSKRFLQAGGMGNAFQLVNYKPDDLLKSLSKTQDFESIAGLRIFTLNNVKGSLEWQKNFNCNES